MSSSARFRIISTLIAIAIVFLATLVKAEFTNEKCSHVLVHTGDILIQRDWDESTRVCFISLHPMDVINMKYRDYYFDNAGLFLVFNSYGEGNISETTGARGFMTFPQIYDYPDFSIENNGDVVVRMVSGHTIRLNHEKFSIKEFSPGTFIENPISPNNGGGLEIFPSKGFWLDQGFKMGGMAIENKLGKTKIFGGKGGVCTLKNTRLYDYSTEQYNLLYAKEQLSAFVRQTCPVVKFSFHTNSVNP